MGLAVAIGVPFGVLVSSGALGGMWLDGRFGTKPWITVAGVVLGAVLAFVNLVRVVTRLAPDKDGSSSDDDGRSRG